MHWSPMCLTKADPIQGRVAELDKFAGGLIGRISKSGELTGKNLELTLVHGARRIEDRAAPAGGRRKA